MQQSCPHACRRVIQTLVLLFVPAAATAESESGARVICRVAQPPWELGAGANLGF